MRKIASAFHLLQHETKAQPASQTEINASARMKACVSTGVLYMALEVVAAASTVVAAADAGVLSKAHFLFEWSLIS